MDGTGGEPEDHGTGLGARDHIEIREVIALHGHLVDAGAQRRLGEVFADDVIIDAASVGMRELPIDDPSRSLVRYIEEGERRGTTSLAAHVTNVIVRESSAGAHAWSKAIILGPDGSISSFTYEDDLVRSAEGWRIRRRRITPRREPGTGPEPIAP